MPPIVLIIFNRPDLVERQVAILSRLPLEQLFVIADGPRPGLEDETKCRDARSVIENTAWPCSIQKNYADHNMGCASRIISGLDWVFSHVDRAIILEDDCLANPSFFGFCEELLEFYRNDDEIMQICGTNRFAGIDDACSYWFSRFAVCWGWATWRRAWLHNDLSMNIPDKEIKRLLRHYLQGNHAAVDRWLMLINKTRHGLLDAWDYPWQLSIWRHGGAVIIPARNLVTNAGFRVDATHTKNPGSPVANLQLQEIGLPLDHPPDKNYGYQYDSQITEIFAQGKRSGHVKNRLKKLYHMVKRLIG